MTLLKAFFVGLIVAIPVGPIAILIFQRSLSVGYITGIASGIGAALADALFAFLASLGVVALADWMAGPLVWLRPVGGAILIILGVHFFFKRAPSLKTEEVLTTRYLHHYTWDAFSTFLLTLTNPMTMLAFAALFTGVAIVPMEVKRIYYLEISAGVFVGSFLWWSVIVLLSHPIRKIISPLKVHRLMQILALILVGLGVAAVIYGSARL